MAVSRDDRVAVSRGHEVQAVCGINIAVQFISTLYPYTGVGTVHREDGSSPE